MIDGEFLLSTAPTQISIAGPSERPVIPDRPEVGDEQFRAQGASALLSVPMQTAGRSINFLFVKAIEELRQMLDSSRGLRLTRTSR